MLKIHQFSHSSPKIHSQNYKIKENPEISNTQKPRNPKTQTKPSLFQTINNKINQPSQLSSWNQTNTQTRKTQPNSAHWIKLGLLIFYIFIFFFLISFFRFGYLIFGFDFLGLGICSGFLILGFGSSQRFFWPSLKIAGVGFLFVLVGSEHGL